MEQVLTPDICVIGAGSAGLAASKGAREFGAEVVLVERDRMGGDCLNYGCVPSKALLAASHVAEQSRRSGDFGISISSPKIDGRMVNRHVQGVMTAIAPSDSIETMEGQGIKVVQGSAHFINEKELEVGQIRIRARRFVIATGCHPVIPPVPGLKDVHFFTNETIFNFEEIPEHLVILGGGAVGVEMAQAYSTLGSRITLLESASSILGNEDPEIRSFVREKLIARGVCVTENASVDQVQPNGGGIAICGRKDGREFSCIGSHLLVAAGRKPTLADLRLDLAGVELGNKGILVDDRLRTSNRNIYAAGDVVGHMPLAHVAGYHGRIVACDAFGGGPATVDYRAMPHVIFSDPELAHCGLTEQQAREKHQDINVGRWHYRDINRAQSERETNGLIKVVASSDGQVLGASIVGYAAGEAIQVWVFAIALEIPLQKVAGIVLPYPTIGYANRALAEAMSKTASE